MIFQFPPKRRLKNRRLVTATTTLHFGSLPVLVAERGEEEHEKYIFPLKMVFT